MTESAVQDEKIRQHEERIKGMEHHIEVSNKEMGELRDGINEVKTDVAWLKKFFWIVATSSVGAVVTGIINILGLK